MHHVVAAEPGHYVGDLVIATDSFPRRLGAAGAPAGEPSHVQTSLLELFCRLRRIDSAKVEDGKGRSAGLDGVEIQAVECCRIQQVRADRPGVADFKLLCGLKLANLIVQQRIAAIPARIPVVHIEKASGKLMLSQVIVQLGQALVIPNLAGYSIQKLSRWVAGSGNLGEERAGEARNGNLIAGERR